jgi:hypothetical protein
MNEPISETLDHSRESPRLANRYGHQSPGIIRWRKRSRLNLSLTESKPRSGKRLSAGGRSIRWEFRDQNAESSFWKCGCVVCTDRSGPFSPTPRPVDFWSSEKKSSFEDNNGSGPYHLTQRGDVTLIFLISFSFCVTRLVVLNFLFYKSFFLDDLFQLF